MLWKSQQIYVKTSFSVIQNLYEQNALFLFSFRLLFTIFPSHNGILIFHFVLCFYKFIILVLLSPIHNLFVSKHTCFQISIKFVNSNTASSRPLFAKCFLKISLFEIYKWKNRQLGQASCKVTIFNIRSKTKIYLII